MSTTTAGNGERASAARTNSTPSSRQAAVALMCAATSEKIMGGREDQVFFFFKSWPDNVCGPFAIPYSVVCLQKLRSSCCLPSLARVRSVSTMGECARWQVAALSLVWRRVLGSIIIDFLHRRGHSRSIIGPSPEGLQEFLQYRRCITTLLLSPRIPSSSFLFKKRS